MNLLAHVLLVLRVRKMHFTFSQIHNGLEKKKVINEYNENQNELEHFDDIINI